MAEFSAQQIANALRGELAARPGSSYDDLMGMATSAYGISPDQFNSGYALYQRGTPVPMTGASVPANPVEPTYESSLIQSLRASSPTAPETPGVLWRANKQNGSPIDFSLSDFGTGLNSNSGLSLNVQKLGNGRTNPKFSYSTDAINQALIDEVQARPGSTYDELLAAAQGYGVTPQEFNAAWTNMGLTNAGIKDINNDGVLDAQDVSTKDASAGLRAELTARPGSSYEALLDSATSVYGLSPEQFNAAWADMGFTDYGLTDVNQDNVVNAGDLSAQDIANAIMAELSARPGASYEALLNSATSVYGLSPEQFNAGYGLYQNPPGDQP